MIKIIIFDFDDTLVDNNFLDHKSFVNACQELSLPNPSSKYITMFRKKGYLAKEISIKLLKKDNKIHLNNFLKIRKKFIQNDESVKYLHLKNKLKPLLNYLRTRKIKCVLCSVRKNKKIVYELLKNEKILQMFSEIIFMEDLGFQIDIFSIENRILVKSSLIHKILKKSHAKISEVLFIGNSEEDFKASLNFRVPFIYFQNNYLPKFNQQNLIKISNMEDLKQEIIKLQGK